VPYFRIFNPVSQSQRFDEQGVFLKQWLPKLAPFDRKQVHAPPAGDLLERSGYPTPIVDLKEGRARALAAFKNLPRKVK
jgi:deoxyribodipyrimidine photo-lyase